MTHQGLERDFAQMNIHVQTKKHPPAVAPKPKMHNSAPAPYRPGGGQYRQFRDVTGEAEFPPPPPQQSGYLEEQQFPPPPQEHSYDFENREIREEFPPPPPQSTSYTYSRDSPDMTNVPGNYTSSYSPHPNTFDNQTYGTTSYTPQNTSPRSYEAQTYRASPRTIEDEYARANMYQHESKQSPYTVRSTSPAGRTSPYMTSNYANLSAIQSSYSNEPTSQEPSPYARPMKVTVGRQYSPTPQDGYVRVGSGGSQGHHSPTPQDTSYSARPGSASPRGQISPRYQTELPSERPVPGPQVPATYIDDDLISPKENKANKEAEVDALTNLLMQNMESTSDPDFYGMCSKCGTKVMGESNGCTAMDQIFHIGCFICINCGTLLRGKSFYSMDNKPYCEPCYMNSLEKCSVCSKPITDRLLRATGKPYHPACFVCVVCGKSLDGIPFTVDATNQIHCIEDFHSKFAPRCCVCQTPIVPEPGQEETVRVVAMDRSFHVHCYRCEDCGLQLSSEADGRGCYPLDEHILCKTCNAKRIQMMTTKMATEL